MTLTASGLTKLEEVLADSPKDQTASEEDAVEGEEECEEDFVEEVEEDLEALEHESVEENRDKWSIVGREELIDFLIGKQSELVPQEKAIRSDDETSCASDGEEYNDDVAPLRPLVVGMVGYPNVGKSSTINALLGASTLAHGMKRVSVGSTPGKTKHFQVASVLAAEIFYLMYFRMCVSDAHAVSTSYAV